MGEGGRGGRMRENEKWRGVRERGLAGTESSSSSGGGGGGSDEEE